MRNDFLFFVVLGCGNFLLLAVLDRWLEYREQRQYHIARSGGRRRYRKWRRRVWAHRLSFRSLRRFLRQKRWSIDRRRREREMAQWTNPPPWVERTRLKGKRR
jgi:hypothetical protein